MDSNSDVEVDVEINDNKKGPLFYLGLGLYFGAIGTACWLTYKQRVQREISDLQTQIRELKMCIRSLENDIYVEVDE